MSRRTKEELVLEIVADLQANLYDSEDFLWSLVKESLFHWPKSKLEKYMEGR